MSESTPARFRVRQICVSNAVAEACACMAEVMQMPGGADEYADITLGQLLENQANLKWLIARSRSDREKRLDDWRAKQTTKAAEPEDQLP